MGNPTAKIEYFPSGTWRLKIDISPTAKKVDISHREADCFLLTYPIQTPVLLSGPA